MAEDIAVKRFKFMRRLYELTEGEESQSVHFSKLQEHLGFSTDLLNAIIYYLETENLITYQTPGNLVRITPAGADEVEGALIEPDRATKHFPPRENLAAKKMMEQQMMQDSYEKSHTITIGESKYKELQEILTTLSTSLDKLNLSLEQKATLQAEIKTIETQIYSPKPKATIIPGSLTTIKRILESAARTPFEYGLLIKITAIIG